MQYEYFSCRSFVDSACKKSKEVCRGADDCCPVRGIRMVCAPHLNICSKKTCCITEVQEQEEKQAEIIRNRLPKSKRFWQLLLDEYEDD